MNRRVTTHLVAPRFALHEHCGQGPVQVLPEAAPHAAAPARLPRRVRRWRWRWL